MVRENQVEYCRNMYLTAEGPDRSQESDELLRFRGLPPEHLDCLFLLFGELIGVERKVESEAANPTVSYALSYAFWIHGYFRGVKVNANPASLTPQLPILVSTSVSFL